MGFAGPLLMLAGTGMQSLSAYRQGQYAAQQSNAQAALAHQDAMAHDVAAESSRQAGVFNQLRSLKKGQSQVAELRAAIAGAGGGVSEVADQLVGKQMAENAEERGMIGYNSLLQAKQEEYAAMASRNTAANLKTTAKNAMRAGKLGAVTSAVSGLGNMYLLGGFSGWGGGNTPYIGQPGAAVDYNKLSPFQQELFRSMS